jgi:integrase/recombinase XerD
MADKSLVGSWVRRFLMEHVVGERNLTRNTQRSYRDTLCLLLPFVTRKVQKPIDRLTVEDVSADQIRSFLQDLENSRGCAVTTRNQRLAAIHALARFVAEHSPEHIEWAGQIRTIPFKKGQAALVPYLEKPEMDALLAAPDRETAQGRRDYSLLLFLYNSGARADEAAHLTIADIDLANAVQDGQGLVRINGKGGKVRHCPLWATTVREMETCIRNRDPKERVFLNRCGRPLTRFGIYEMVHRYADQVSTKLSTLSAKRVSPHTIRHTTATHLLRAGVDINTIRAWLGHVSLITTNVYAEIDVEMKAKALAKCEVGAQPTGRKWRDDPELMTFLRGL